MLRNFTPWTLIRLLNKDFFFYNKGVSISESNKKFLQVGLGMYVYTYT